MPVLSFIGIQDALNKSLTGQQLNMWIDQQQLMIKKLQKEKQDLLELQKGQSSKMHDRQYLGRVQQFGKVPDKVVVEIV